MWVLLRGHSGDGFDLVSTLCMYDLRKGDLFVMSWAWVRLVVICHGQVRCRCSLMHELISPDFAIDPHGEALGELGTMEEACSSRSLQDNKTNSPSQVVY